MSADDKLGQDEAAQTLAQVLSAVEPALEAISTTIVVKECCETKGPKPIQMKHKSRGLRVLGEGPRFGDGTMDGPIDGEDVILLESGTLATVRYSGKWSGLRKGERYEWSAVLHEVNPRQLLTTREPVVVTQIVDYIHAALEAQRKGNKTKRTDELIYAAKLMKSVSFLLTGRRGRPVEPRTLTTAGLLDGHE